MEEFYLDRLIELRDAREAIKEEGVDTAELSLRIDTLEKLFSDDPGEEHEEEDIDAWVARQEQEWKDVSLG